MSPNQSKEKAKPLAYEQWLRIGAQPTLALNVLLDLGLPEARIASYFRIEPRMVELMNDPGIMHKHFVSSPDRADKG